MKNKKIIFTTIIVILFFVTLFTGYILKKSLFGNKIQKINNGVINELITKNYKEEFHSLNLRGKKLGEMPDICQMVSGTHFENDIQILDLADNGIVEINKNLGCLKNLSELYLSFNKIKEIRNIENLNSLKKLDLGNNEIKDVTGLEKLINIKDLHLGYNQISSTKGLEKLINLTSLQLQSNKLEDISNLSNLTKLQTLKMEFNKLDNEDIKIVEKLKNLKIITVGENAGINKEIIDKFNKLSLSNN